MKYWYDDLPHCGKVRSRLGRPKNTLDYSSLPEERGHEDPIERERREALELYNESTFGERHPIKSVFIQIFATVMLAVLLMALFGRGPGYVLAIGSFLSYRLWWYVYRG